MNNPDIFQRVLWPFVASMFLVTSCSPEPVPYVKITYSLANQADSIGNVESAVFLYEAENTMDKAQILAFNINEQLLVVTVDAEGNIDDMVLELGTRVADGTPVVVTMNQQECRSTDEIQGQISFGKSRTVTCY